jgi:hypothetical protein
MVAWDRVTHADALRALKEYDRLGLGRFFSKHGFAPTTTYELIWEERPQIPSGLTSIGSLRPRFCSAGRLIARFDP